jgi:hypothetical protein
MLCKCGHQAMAHRHDNEGRQNRGPCSADVRRFFTKPGPGVLRSGDIVLSPEQTKAVLETAQDRAATASSYTKKFAKLLYRGFEIIGCQCPMYHTVDLGQVSLIIPGNQPRR